MRPRFWYVWVVAGALLAASLACTIEFSTAHFANVKLYKEPDRETARARVYAPEDSFVCLADLKDAPDPVLVRGVWYRVFEDETGQRKEVVAEQEIMAANGPLTFVADPPADGWERGAYRLELLIDGDSKAAVDFNVR